MTCTRYQTDGMRLVDGELTAEEKSSYEAHVRGCDACRRELESLGRIIAFADELRFRVPDDEFWDGYWESVYRRSERGVGFLLLIAGALVLLGYGLFRLVTGPHVLTVQGIAIALALVGLAVLFISVARERYHESRNDPYRKVQR